MRNVIACAAAVVMAAFGLPNRASADVIDVTYFGTVTHSNEQNPRFGAAAGIDKLVGASWTAKYVFDTSRAPIFCCLSANEVHGGAG
jgi:hypothetical protein